MKIKGLQSKGFTIIELMIALSVLSIILVIASALMTRIGATYTKGVNAANLQNANRNIMSDLTSALQLSGSAPSGCPTGNDIGTTCYTALESVPGADVYAYCIGATRYSYILNREQGDDPSYLTYGSQTHQTQPHTSHVLWRDTMMNTASCNPLDISQPMPAPFSGDSDVTVAGSGYDMVPDHMRLGRFKITQVTPPNNSGVYNLDVWMAYGDSDLVNEDASGHATCNGDKGSQFCSVSNISSTVGRRLNN